MSNFIDSIGAVISINVLGRLFGFLREITLSYYYGSSAVSDAYILSQIIPGTLFQFVGIGLSTCYIPIYYSILKNNGHKQANEFTDNIFSITTLFSIILIVIVWVFAPYIIYMFSSGLDKNTFNLTVQFTKIGIISLLFSTCVYVSNSFLNANNDFVTAAIAALPYSITIIVAIIFGKAYNIYLMSLISACASLVQAFFVYPNFKKLHGRLRFRLTRHDKNIKSFLTLLIPTVFTVMISQLQVIADKNIASYLATGAITSLTYANELIMIPQGVFSQTINNMYFPLLNKAIVEDNFKDLAKYLRNSVMLNVFLLMPCIVGLICLAKPVIKILFCRGAFDDIAAAQTTNALIGYTFGLIGIAMQDLFARVYYAMQEMSIPVSISAGSLALNIVLNIILSIKFGIIGISLATSIASLMSSSVLGFMLLKRFNNIFDKIFVTQIIKIASSSLIMGIVCALMCHVMAYLKINIYLSTLSAIITSVIVYETLTYLLRANYTGILIKGMIKND